MIGHHFRKWSDLKIDVIKKINNKSLHHNSYSSMEKKKDSNDSWRTKITFKLKFWHFLTPYHSTNLQNSIISFDNSWFLAKNLSNFVSLHWKLHNRECHNENSAKSSHIGNWINFKSGTKGAKIKRIAMRLNSQKKPHRKSIWLRQLFYLTKRVGSRP